jgi:predicted site-specific integrase-resolvase
MRDVHYVRTATGHLPVLDEQKLACQLCSDQDGSTVVGIFGDVGSGLDCYRWGYRQMLRCLRRGGVDRLIVESVFRLTTHPYERARLRTELATLGVELVVWGDGAALETAWLRVTA